MYFWTKRSNNGVIVLTIKSEFRINYVNKINDKLYHVYRNDNTYKELKIFTEYLDYKYSYIDLSYKENYTYIYTYIPSGLKIKQND